MPKQEEKEKFPISFFGDGGSQSDQMTEVNME